MSAPKCDDVRSLLAHRALGVLDDAEQARVKEHLPSCPKCERRAGELELAYAELEDAAAEPVPPELWSKIEAAIAAPAPSSAPIAETPSREPRVALACCFCHATLDRKEAVYCAACLAPHHADCFREHGRCSALGCEETRTVRPELAAVPTRSRIVVIARVAAAVLLIATVGIGGGILITTTLIERSEAIKEEASHGAQRDEAAQAAARAATLRRLEEIERRLDATLARLDLANGNAEVAKLIDELAALTSQMKELGAGDDDLRAKAVLCERKVAEARERAKLAKRIDDDLAELRHLFEEMRSAFEQKQLARVEELSGVIIDSYGHMKQRDGDAFTAKADRFLVMALDLRDKAQKLAASQPAPKPDEAVSITLDDKGRLASISVARELTVRALIDAIAKKVGKTILVDPAVTDKVGDHMGPGGDRLAGITVRFDLPWRDAVAEIARTSGAELTTLPGGTLFVRPRPATITANLAGFSLHGAIATIARDARQNVIAASDVAGDAAGELADTPWRDALEKLMREHELRATRIGAITVVSRAPLKLREERRLELAEVGRTATLDLDVDEKPLGSVLDVIAKALGPKIAADAELKDAKITLHAKALDARDALWFVARLAHAEIEIARKSEIALRAVPRCSVRAHDAPARAFLSALGLAAGTSVLSHAELDDVSIGELALDDVRLDDAILACAAAHGITLERHGASSLSATTAARPTVREPRTPLELEAVIYVEGRRDLSFAIIGGRLMSVGGSIHDVASLGVLARVLEIRRGSVTIESEKNGEITTLDFVPRPGK